ncbi:MAG: tripartite tricarboxylate transporter substrate binding protein BugD [Clostridia bacterium]|nr:tripartite tricarboxylate transporter substrate binding protein BugD [Deltaproteobacteria bacterium]
MTTRLIWSLAALVFSFAATAAEQDYPTKQIIMVVPFTAGGPTDTLGRNLAATMAKTLKQQVIIENVGGAGGTLGVQKVARSKPDGYYVLLHHIGMSTAPALYRKLPFNPLTDFEYVGQVADVPMTVIAKKTLAPDNFKDFIPYVKQNKAKLNYGNAGLGAASHLCGLLLMSALQTDVQTVPFQGTGPAMTALLGGEIDFMCDQTTNTTGQILAGGVKVYGVTSPKRVASLPNVPTLQEQGLKGFDVVVWHGLYAPKGTPKAVLDRLNAALKIAIQEPAFKESLAKLGASPVGVEKATPEALATHLKSEIERWGPIIKKAGVYAD